MDKKQALGDVGYEEPKEDGIATTTIFRQLAKDFYEKQPYFYDKAGLWWIWNKKEYHRNSSEEIKSFNL